MFIIISSVAESLSSVWASMALLFMLLITATTFLIGPVMAGYDYQPSYDRQYDTYHSQHVEGRCKEGVTVTPYFSPDHSIDTYVSLINSANESIDIFTPGIHMHVYRQYNNTMHSKYYTKYYVKNIIMTIE